MAARNKPYEQFGPYILFKKLESDSLGDLWRAGRVEGGAVSTVALRRLTGGNRTMLGESAETANGLVRLLTGTSFVRDQVIDVQDNIPYVAYAYNGGRSLRHIANRARGSQAAAPNPIPIDQAVVVAEKVALSLATMADLRLDNARLLHGALIPQFIWISDDGEIRVAGQGLGPGLVSSLRDPAIAAELGRYVSPEMQSTGKPSKSSEVYAMGAILYLLVTGQEPPDSTNASAFTQAVRAARMVNGEAVPDDIRAVLNKSLVLDPMARYGTIGDMKQALSSLAHSGRYSASTFNLAFYISTLLKKELEGEAIDREKESKVSLAAYADSNVATAAPVVTERAAVLSVPPPARNKAPLAVAAALVVAGIALGAWYVTGSRAKSGAPAVTAASLAPTPRPKIVSEPVIASGSEATPGTTLGNAAATSTAVDAAAQRKAFEEAVRQKLQEEMLKLQTDYTKQLQQEKSKNAPVVAAAAAEESSPSAAELDQKRVAAKQESVPQPINQAVAPTAAPVTQTTAPAVAPLPAAPAPQPAATSAIREGDIVDVLALDAVPKPLQTIRPVYPPLALRQRAEGSVILTVLISENGDVTDVKVLRGVNGFGFNDAAMHAVRATKFTAPMKDGKRVKTWFPQQILFKP